MSKIILNLVANTKSGNVLSANPFYKSNQSGLQKQSAFISLDRELIEDQLEDGDFDSQYRELKTLLALVKMLEDKEDGEIVHLSFKVNKVKDNEVDKDFEPDLELI